MCVETNTLEKHRRPNVPYQSRKHFEHKYANHFVRFRGHAIAWHKWSRKIQQLRQHLNLGKTFLFKAWYKKQVDAEIKREEQCCQNWFGNICEPKWSRNKTNIWIIFWQSVVTLAALRPSMRAQFDIKENWPALSHPSRTSQLHCLQYFFWRGSIAKCWG